MPLYDNTREQRATMVISRPSVDGASRLLEVLSPQYLSGICGIVMAIVALIATGSFDELTSSRQSSGQARTSTSATHRSAPAIHSGAVPGLDLVGRQGRVLMLYLVDSDEQADKVYAGEAEAERERTLASMSFSDYDLRVLKATTPQELASVSEVLEAWSTPGFGVRIVDLR